MKNIHKENKKKVFCIGNTHTETGPAVINKYLRKYAPSNVKFSSNKSKLFRILEVLFYIPFNDIICFLSYSKLNFFAAGIAKFFRKKTSYLMHGSVGYEALLNDGSKYIFDEERKFLKRINKVVCVSRIMEQKALELYPFLKSKTTVVYNAVEIHSIIRCSETKGNDIIATGGGMVWKNNLSVCQAIQVINSEKENKINMTIIDHPTCKHHTDEIIKFDFVNYKPVMSNNKLLEMFSKSKLYVMNSVFESFGIAPLEALACGCDLLLSSNSGIVELFDNLEENDIIRDNYNIEEVAIKIKYLLEHGNNNRLKNCLNNNLINEKYSAELFFQEIYYIKEQ